jgi:hypothetical protein
MEENKTKPQKKTLTFSQIRANSIIAMAKDFRKNENLSYGDANKKATLIDSYTAGGHFKRGIKYTGNDKLILKFLPERAKKIKKETKKTSILNKGN